MRSAPAPVGAGVRPAPWLAAAPADATGGWSTGYAAGYAAGWSQGAQAAAEKAEVALAAELERSRAERAAAEQRSQVAVAALAAAAAQLDAREAPVLADLTDAVARVALELATAVLGVEVLTGAGARAALQRALAAAPEGAVAVHLHPADIVEVSVETSVPGRVQLVPDPTLRRGDALATYPGGSVDARLEDALERGRAALLGLDESGAA